MKRFNRWNRKLQSAHLSDWASVIATPEKAGASRQSKDRNERIGSANIAKVYFGEGVANNSSPIREVGER